MKEVTRCPPCAPVVRCLQDIRADMPLSQIVEKLLLTGAFQIPGQDRRKIPIADEYALDSS